MEVRNFEKNDLEVFLFLCEKFYSSGATRRSFDRHIAEMTFQRVIDKHENLWGKFLVDLDINTPVGYALITSYWCNEDGGNVIILDEIFIDENVRKKGFGSFFMDWAEEEYKGYAKAITLYVVKDNDAAHRLYIKHGYEYGGFEQMFKPLLP